MTEQNDFQSCSIIGLGYIGLPTSVVIARSGMHVTGVDVSAPVVAAVNAGQCPIEEPFLADALAGLVAQGRIRAQSAPTAADVFIIAVPTPFAGGYKPDLSYVEAATRAIAPVLKRGNLVVVESTIPIGATETVARWIEGMRPDLTCARRGSTQHPDILVAHCPERVLPGQMLRELVENDRVIGGVCPASGRAGQAFYERFVTGKCLVTDARTAELCKLSENSFRDVNIAFANELSDICEDTGIDVGALIALANHHPRVNILQPGPGVGGHCIAVDPWFIVSALGEKARLIREARWINSGRPRQVVRKILDRVAAGGVRSIGCFGLSYKPDVDDLRESPAVEVVEYLAQELHLTGSSIELRVAEPYVTRLPRSLRDARHATLVETEQALDADLLVMLVDHKQFRKIALSRLSGKQIVDTRGIWSRSAIAARAADSQKTALQPLSVADTAGSATIDERSVGGLAGLHLPV
jgi:UDP-N-acetyl-D-mannosaminuronic acid dehydrogenase